ncbi:MAG: glycosyl transferase [Candidatus Taylorbacteria bacterium]|nr:glycosyl transferase [Candidatus Taylorbacteria bacterium]
MTQKSPYHFCTLFDKGFLLKGVALHESLVKHAENFTLWILCMDTETRTTLEKLNLENVLLLSLQDIETEAVLNAKKTRNNREYCWTLSSVLTLYVMERNDIESIAYLDADTYFFSSPETIYKEFENHSILIIPHRLFWTRKDKEKEVGKYNVSLPIFRKDENGLACLHWWQDRCLEWCFDRIEPNRYGDQKYLDFFEEKFMGVHPLQNEGANVATWNMEGKEVTKKNGVVYIGDTPLIFFHYSGFVLYPPTPLLPYGPDIFHKYTKTSPAKDLIYRPYAKTLYRILDQIRHVDPQWSHGLTPRPPLKKSLREFWHNTFHYPSRRATKKLLSPIIKMIQS